MINNDDKKKIIDILMSYKILVDRDLLTLINSLTSDELNILEDNILENTIISKDNLINLINDIKKGIFKKIIKPSVQVIDSFDELVTKKRDINDFISHFRERYKQISKILRGREELSDVLSINRIMSKEEDSKVSLIGMVYDKSETKNGNIILDIEDLTGVIRVIITKRNQDLFERAKDIVNDEVIGLIGFYQVTRNGKYKNQVIFGNEIFWPDVPLNKELKKSPDESYAIFLSDIHVGSIDFLPYKFEKFCKWLAGEFDFDTKIDVKKIKYLFLAGDVIEGIGIYPGQDNELTIKDIIGQYDEVARLLKKIPERIKIIICPGNHDATSLAEPQPPLSKDLAGSLYDMKNVYLVSNPALVNIHKSNDFPGFDVLLYHGYSFDNYVANVDSIRTSGGYHRADLLMEFFLKRRHLSPTHGFTPYVADPKKDNLVISKAPDFFVTGHIHYSSVSNYKNITLICGSCWQGKTSFQLKTGHDPEPARVPVVNLQTRKVDLLIFDDIEDDENE